MTDPTWPPTGRPPTPDEIADGVAIINDDGSVSWSPTEDDFDGIDDEEVHSVERGRHEIGAMITQAATDVAARAEAAATTSPDEPGRGPLLLVDEVHQITPDPAAQLRRAIDELVRAGRKQDLPALDAERRDARTRQYLSLAAFADAQGR